MEYSYASSCLSQMIRTETPQFNKMKCEYCGSWTEEMSKCESCGAPVGESDATILWRQPVLITHLPH